jgi:hypothetical protein
MKRFLVAVILIGYALNCYAQTEAVKPDFRGKVVEAVQLSDGVDPLDAEVSYALNLMNARNAVMAVVRMASTEKEIEAADALRSVLFYCDLARKYGQMVDNGKFKENLDLKSQARSFALAAVGTSTEKIYPTPKIRWNSRP